MKKKKIEICSIIPARSGSKTIKNKNILKINNFPMMSYSIYASKKSKFINKTLFTSDSKKYIRIAKKFKPDFLHLRSKKNASDIATDLDFLKEVKKYLTKEFNYNPDLFVLLRANTPTRNVKDIDNAIKIFLKNKSKYTGLRSVSLMSETSYKTFYIKNKKLVGIMKKSFDIDNLNLPKEKFKKTYSGNGCIDIIKSENIDKGILNGNKVYAYVPKNLCIDIDYFDDIETAKILIKKKNYLKIKI